MVLSSPFYKWKGRVFRLSQMKALREDQSPISSPFGMSHVFKIPSYEKPLASVHRNKILCSSFLGSRARLLTGGKDNQFILWDLERQMVESVRVPLVSPFSPRMTTGVRQILYKFGSDVVVVTGLGNTCISFLDTSTLNVIAFSCCHPSPIISAGFASAGLVCSCDEKKNIFAWNLSQIVQRKYKEYDPDRFLKLYKQRPLQMPLRFAIPIAKKSIVSDDGYICGISSGQKSNNFGMASSSAEFLLWDSDAFVEIQKLKCSASKCATMTYAEEAGLFCLGCDSGVHLIDSRSDKSVMVVGNRKNVRDVNAMDCFESNLAIGDKSGSIMIYDLRQIHECFTLYESPRRDGNNCVFTLKWSPDGSMMFAGGGPARRDEKGSFSICLF